jgi:hypothetical protein
MSQLFTVCRSCVSDGVPRRSFFVALIVVGAILNLINQGDAPLSGGAQDLTKLVLAFVVPYCVATYGAVSFRLSVSRGREWDDGPRSLQKREPSFFRTTKGGR